MRLDVGVVGTEQLPGALDGQRLDLVHMLAATVVALARIALGVLVGQAAALRLHDALAAVVLRGDQLDVVFLALFFGLDRREQGIVITLQLVVLAEHGEALFIVFLGMHPARPGEGSRKIGEAGIEPSPLPLGRGSGRGGCVDNRFTLFPGPSPASGRGEVHYASWYASMDGQAQTRLRSP